MRHVALFGLRKRLSAPSSSSASARRLRRVAGLIRDEDIALVRERARIDEVVSAYVTLRNAGGGSLKGLCPFHDEKSPSFNVTPVTRLLPLLRLREGGDVITFLKKIDGLGFAEAVERLAEKVRRPAALRGGRRAPGPARRPPAAAARSRPTGSPRSSTPSSSPRPRRSPARQFLDRARLRPEDGGRAFGVGLRAARRRGAATAPAPEGVHRRGAGRRRAGRRRAAGLYDRFRGRLLWPIRDSSGDTIGFGARRMFDDDRIEAKYLNTPETPIYKKSHVLYGIDLARREIARAAQAVVVEGYTDVMACHLAGVPTAVATCGTAFGEDHARVLRRLLHDHDEFRGEVIFTFDGDEAGQKAALRAFERRPAVRRADLRRGRADRAGPVRPAAAEGDAAVRELVARRVPLYRFVLGNVVAPLRPRPGRRPHRRDARGGQAGRERPRPVQGGRVRARAGRHGRHRADDVRARSARAAARRARRRPRRRRRCSRQAAPSCPTCATRGSRSSARRSSWSSSTPTVVGRIAEDVDADDFTHRAYRARLGGGQPAAAGPAARRRAAGPPRCATRRPTSGSGRWSARSTVEPLHAAREPDDGLRRGARLPAAGAHRDAPDRRPQVQAAAHQPGRAGHRVQPDVRRAGRARGAPPALRERALESQ